MNRDLVWIVALLALSCSSAKIQKSSEEPTGKSADISSATATSDSLSTGLVAWYPFNGNANDVSGHGFNGVVNGAMLVADRFGHPNSAYSFNGFSDYINCGDILDSVFCGPVATFTISGWAITRRLGTRQAGGGCIIAKSGGGDAGPYQWSVTHFVGNVVYAAAFSEPTGTKQFVEKSDGPAPLNQWFHFVYVFDGNLPEYDRLKIYINRQRSEEKTVRHIGMISTTTTETAAPLCIGSTMSLPSFPGNYYNGIVDDIRIYNRALSSTEVEMLYHEGGYYPASPQGLAAQSFTPKQNALDVTAASPMTVTFNAAVNALTVNNTTVIVNGSVSGRHESTFGYFGDTRTMRITPKLPFAPGEVVTVTLARGIIGTTAVPMARSYSWSFTVKTNSGSGVLGPRLMIPMGMGSSPHSVVASDFDTDGKLDLAVANFEDRSVVILRNNGSGTFTETAAVGVGDGPNCLVSADLDGDGRPDLVATNFRGSTINVLRNEGGGNFTASSVVAEQQPVSIAAADFDGDGWIDLAVANNASNSVLVLKNRGGGSLVPMSRAKVGLYPTSVVAADFNNDGFIDLAVTNSQEMTVTVLLNDGNGTFTLTRSVRVGKMPWCVAAADLNGDGNVDLAVANNESGTISILLNDGRANFTSGSNLDVGGTPSVVTALDANGDGSMDLAVADNSRNTLSLWFNNGTCSFTAGSVINVGNYPCSIVAADLDGDGGLEVATANGVGNSVSILSNKASNLSSDRVGGSTAGAGPLELKLKFTSPNGDRTLYGGEIGGIEIEVKNTGQKIARNVSAKVSVFPPTSDVRFTPVISIGDVPANAALKTGCTISASHTVKSQYLNIIVQIVAEEGVVVPTRQMSITIKSRTVVDNNAPDTTLRSPAQNPARIAHDPGTIETKTEFVSPAGYQVLYPGDKGNLKILVRNVGQNVVKNAKARLAVGPPTNDIQFDRLILIGDIAPGAEVESGCSVIASQNVGTRSLEISVQIVADEGIVVRPKFIAISTKAGATADKTGPEIRLVKPQGIPVDPSRGMKTFSGSGVIRTKETSIVVEGTAQDASGIAAVRINGTDVQLKTGGRVAQFSETVSLSPGENRIEIVAIDNFRNESSMRIGVFREGGSVTVHNYALLIAEGNYDTWPHLVNPVPDAQAIADELKKSYGFKTELLQDVTRDGILTALRRYAEMKFNDNDQLFIFYAGHGQFDPVLGDGYLVAKDSRLNDDIKTSYVAHSVLRTIVNNIPCRHIFLVVDACFGGTIDPLIAANSRGDEMYGEVSKTEFIQRKMQFKTRRFLTSGGKEYVPDGRPGQHSPFVRKFLEALRSYGGSDGVLTINEILQYEEKVTPQPRAGEFGANEPGSDFVFIAR